MDIEKATLTEVSCLLEGVLTLLKRSVCSNKYVIESFTRNFDKETYYLDLILVRASGQEEVQRCLSTLGFCPLVLV